MRELVYLSDQKLESFLLDPQPWWKTLRANAKLGGTLGGIEIKHPPASAPDKRRKLELVIKHIAVSAKLYDDNSVQVGDWVAFAVPLSHLYISRSYYIHGSTCAAQHQ